jgi:outer membrane protein assembly factor BamB
MTVSLPLRCDIPTKFALRRIENMRHPRDRFLSISVLLAICITTTCTGLSTVHADDWPQWQGPDRNGMSKEKGLLQEWPAGGPTLVRKIPGLGGGDGAPAIAKGRIYGMGHRGGKEVVWAFSESDGSEVWSTPLGPAFAQSPPQGKEGPGCTPTVDGDRLYVLGMGGDLACLQTADGKVVWRKNLVKDFGGKLPQWSYRESPLIDGDKLLCTPGAADATFVALDKKTGDLLWKSKPPENGAGGDGKKGGGGGSGAAYASIVAIDADGQRQYVQLASKALVGIAATDGKFLWHYDKPANSTGINCTSPFFYDGLVFASSAYGAGGGAVKLSPQADGGIKADEVWFSKRMQNHHGGVVVVDGALYGANGGNGGGALICLDYKTGDVLWDARSSGKVPKGSVALADGRIYYRTEEGPILLIEPSRKEYLERGRFDQPDRTSAPAWSHPVIANGKMYIRDQDSLYCYDIKAK